MGIAYFQSLFRFLTSTLLKKILQLSNHLIETGEHVHGRLLLIRWLDGFFDSLLDF